ncbi:MAG TPA: hypothetical protein VE932_03435 [Patescibacteria group bacterium]|nr:hypothetical protein [Patescibacteria group bacterium]
MRLFLDNTTSPYLARAVAVLEEGSDRLQVTHLREKFASNTPDIVWINALGTEKDWVIISGDLRITRNAAEREAWRESGLTAFFLKNAWASQQFWLFASRFLAWWPRIVAQARMAPRGKGFFVPFSGQRFEDVS